MLPSAIQDGLTLQRDGAELWRDAAAACLPAIERAVADRPADQAGIRLVGIDALSALLVSDGPIGSRVAAHLGSNTRPVRMILFDKSAATNWALGWHQDRTIVVRTRVDVPGFGAWTLKSGLLHVAPPIDLLSRMVTIRVHLDPVPMTNAPLLIAPGSHRLGRVSEAEIGQAVAHLGSCACLAEAGDIWAYATPILHASDAAVQPRRRRVLQVDYSAEGLPGGLEWLGID